MNRRIKNAFQGLLVLAVTLVVLVIALKALTWLPTVIDKGIIRQYVDIESARTELSLDDIQMPTYFPETFEWPPSTVLAQTSPFKAVVVEVKSTETQETVLIISQSERADFSPSGRLRITLVSEEVSYDVNGSYATLLTGRCAEAPVCSRIYWDKNGYRVDLSMQSSPFELIRIARSMR